MAIYCSQCGKQHPNDAKFCMGCGSSLQRGGKPPKVNSGRLEYKDITIPLNIKQRYKTGFFKGEYAVNRASAEADSIILSYIQREGQNGWVPDGSTAFEMLKSAGRVHMRSEKSVLSGNLSYEEYLSVTIRFKRFLP